VSRRTIRWNGSGISNNGDSFYVIAGGSGGGGGGGGGGGSGSGGSSSGGGGGGGGGGSTPSSDRCGAKRGRCINTNNENCNGQIHTGLCAGPSNIRCCAPRAFAVADEFVAEDFADQSNIANDGTTPTSAATSSSTTVAVVIGVVGGVLVVTLIAIVVILGKKVNA